MARAFSSCVLLTALLFLAIESSLMSTAHAVSLGQTMQAVVPKLQPANPFANLPFKVNLPAAAHEFVERVKAKMDEDPSILQQPASWETILSFVELASGPSKKTHKKIKAANSNQDQEEQQHKLQHKKQHEALLEEDNDDSDEEGAAPLNKGTQTPKKQHYARKTPIQKIAHILEAGGADKQTKSKDFLQGDNHVDTKKNAEPLMQEIGKLGAIPDPDKTTTNVEESPKSSSKISNPFSMIIFLVTLLVVVGGIRFLALVVTKKNNPNIDALDYIIGTKFTTGAMVAGLVGGFVFSFVDSIVLFWTMILLEKQLAVLPGAHEEPSFAVYANILSDLISGAISTSAALAVSQGMSVSSTEQTPFWTQLVGAIFGGILGVMLAKVIPHQTRPRGVIDNSDQQEEATSDSGDDLVEGKKDAGEELWGEDEK